MNKRSAGLVLYRRVDSGIEVLLVHPGGPFWEKKDVRGWSIPKGEFAEGEDPLTVALREFEEETGFPVEGPFEALAPLEQPSRKCVYAWAVEGDCDPSQMRSNTFTMEWPPKSGQRQEFPEVDRCGWFPLSVAKEKLHAGQVGFIDQLADLLATPFEDGQQ
jgi:predicted NUDIX family NTP pyrophosphohydrolase